MISYGFPMVFQGTPQAHGDPIPLVGRRRRDAVLARGVADAVEGEDVTIALCEAPGRTWRHGDFLKNSILEIILKSYCIYIYIYVCMYVCMYV